MKIVHCEKHNSIAIQYIKDDGTVIDSPCPTCADLLKPSQTINHRKLQSRDFKFPTMDEAHINVLMNILEHGFLRVSIPNAKAESLFNHRHKELKNGAEAPRHSPGYHEYGVYNDDVYTYSIAVHMELKNGVTLTDFEFSESKDFQEQDGRVRIADNRWCHALMQMGFGLGRDHDREAVLEWIETNKKMKIYVR